jgi:hypothetical protein
VSLIVWLRGLTLSFRLRIALAGILFSSAALGGYPNSRCAMATASLTSGSRRYSRKPIVLTRFPHIHVTFVHSGSSGDSNLLIACSRNSEAHCYRLSADHIR